MDLSTFLHAFFRSYEADPYGAYLLCTSSLSDFYERCTGKDFSQVSEDSEEFDTFLAAHFRLKTDPEFIRFYAELVDEYVREKLNELYFEGFN